MDRLSKGSANQPQVIRFGKEMHIYQIALRNCLMKEMHLKKLVNLLISLLKDFDQDEHDDQIKFKLSNITKLQFKKIICVIKKKMMSLEIEIHSCRKQIRQLGKKIKQITKIDGKQLRK